MNKKNHLYLVVINYFLIQKLCGIKEPPSNISENNMFVTFALATEDRAVNGKGIQ
jgi:hypothetical protein